MNLPGLEPILNKIDTLGKRERLLMFFMLIVVISLSLWQFYITPMQAKNLSLIKNRKDEQLKVKLLEVQAGGLTEEALKQKMVNVQKQYEQKQKELVEISKKVDEIGAKVVDRSELNEKVLQILLNGGNDLRMVNWENMGSSELFLSEKADKTTAVINPNEISHDSITLNQETISLKFEGGYIGFYDYLKRIEKIDWQLFYVDLDYQVLKYPDAIIRLRVGIPNIEEVA